MQLKRICIHHINTHTHTYGQTHVHAYTSYCTPTYHSGCSSSPMWSRFMNINFTHTSMHDANARGKSQCQKKPPMILAPPTKYGRLHSDVIEVQLCNRVRLRSTITNDNIGNICHVDTCVCVWVRQVLFPSIHSIPLFPSTSQCGPYFMYYKLEQNHAHFCLLSHIHHHTFVCACKKWNILGACESSTMS